MKRTLGDVYPINFATPQTPKAEECTALKHHHHNSEAEAKKHFENKLTAILMPSNTKLLRLSALCLPIKAPKLGQHFAIQY